METQITAKNDRTAEKETVSRRSFLAAVFVGAVAATISVAEPSEAEAQERQFKTFHHERRHGRPRSHTRGRRWHRRIARVHRRGPTKPREGEAPAQ